MKGWLPRNTPGFASIYHAVHGVDDEAPANGSGDEPAPAFTSEALPFAGYYVQRSGWGDDDLYLFMKSSRPGSGHRHGDNNGLQVSAYGRHLLVDCAAPPYGPQFLPEHQKEDNHWFDEGNGYAGSSFSACTVVVDGCTQKIPAKAKPDLGYRTTAGTRWLASEHFDFMEGVFNDGYASESGLTDEQMQQLISGFGRERLAYMIERNDQLRQAGVRQADAIHHRQVLFVRDLDFWIVTDRVEGAGERSQIWNYPPPHEGENAPNFICPGFAPGQVRGDEASRLISTIDPRGPNVHLHHFIDGPLRYESKFGEKYPHRGWFSFGIGGEKVPPVEMHASWSGPTPLVTVIRPTKGRVDQAKYVDLSAGPVSGFTREEGSGRTIYLTSPTPTRLVARGVVAEAEALLVVEVDGSEMVRGLVLGCRSLAAEGTDSSLYDHGGESGSEADFVFEWRSGDGGRVRVVQPLVVPRGFSWAQTRAGVVPAYD